MLPLQVLLSGPDKSLAVIEDLGLSLTNSLVMIQDLVLGILTSCQAMLTHMRYKLWFYQVYALFFSSQIIPLLPNMSVSLHVLIKIAHSA